MEASEKAAAFAHIEGFPSENDSAVTTFLNRRREIQEEERRMKSSYAFQQKLSKTALEACRIVDRIRTEELRSIWTEVYDDQLGKKAGYNVYPGMMFALARERMEKTTLWHVIKRFPKGTLLHSHYSAMVDIRWLLRLCLDRADCLYLISDRHLATAENREAAVVRAVNQPERPVRDVPEDSFASVWTEDYAPGTPVPLPQTVAAFPGGGPPDRFVDWMASKCEITLPESLRHYEGVTEIWRKFRSTFAVIDSWMYSADIFYHFTLKLFDELVDDGIRWADIRIVLAQVANEDGSTPRPETHYMKLLPVFERAIEEFKATEKGASFWGARFIWCGVRHWGTKETIQSMRECVQAKKAFPHLIAGFDLVGQEDLGRTLDDLTQEILYFKEHCAQNGVHIPLFLHAGETNETGGPTDWNLFDAIAHGTRRIGHGYSLYKHPRLIELVKEHNILVESCPISNELLRLTSSILSHPLPALHACGVATCLNNDDPAIFGQTKIGMSYDFWQALQGWDDLGLAGLGSMAENSVRWASFEDCDDSEWQKQISEGASGSSLRAKRIAEWTGEWEEYCKWIVDTFGEA